MHELLSLRMDSIQKACSVSCALNTQCTIINGSVCLCRNTHIVYLHVTAGMLLELLKVRHGQSFAIQAVAAERSLPFFLKPQFLNTGTKSRASEVDMRLFHV